VSRPEEKVEIINAAQLSATSVGPKKLAEYSIPLGANQATLIFCGEKLSADDFDALVDFVEFSKRQFVRAQKASYERVKVESLDSPATQDVE
jgi:hypothetical protein